MKDWIPAPMFQHDLNFSNSHFQTRARAFRGAHHARTYQNRGLQKSPDGQIKSSYFRVMRKAKATTAMRIWNAMAWPARHPSAIDDTAKRTG
jgi:hypothetical protein